jgi:RecB family exonuclease
MCSALDGLTAAAVRAKTASALRQVTITVPNHHAGRDVLYYFARAQSAANVTVSALPQTVSRLAVPMLAPRQPLPYPLLEAAIQRVLAEAPGAFADVADEPITAQALASAAWELTAIAEPTMDSPTPLVADLLRIYRAATDRLTGSYYLQHEAYTAAAERLNELGAIIVYQPVANTRAEQSLLRELQQCGETIEPAVDVTPTQIIHTSDADDEVRAVVRLVRKHLANGVPGHRIGIFYGSDDPYLPLLHEHLTAGHIAFAGPECHALVDRPTARALLGLLELDHDTIPRRELFTLLAARILDAVTVRLTAHRGMHGDSGAGVTIGPIAAGIGRDLDVSIVIGAAEGIIPTPRRDDPLLPPELTGFTARDHMDRQRLAFASAVSAGRAERVVTFPRGNLRGGAEKVPSRWLIPAMAQLAGRDVNVVDWQRETENCQAIVAVESFDVAAQRADDRIGASAASDTEWRLRELASVPANRRRGTLNDPIINRGMAMRSDRLNGRFTRFNGNLSTVKDLITTFDHPVSPTGLELWVQSPYQYFLEHILRLRALADPDETAQIDALTRGTLIHTILERYVLATIDGAELDVGRLHLVAQEVLDEAQADSPGWLEQLWAKDRGTIVRDLDDWFGHDHTDHAGGWRPTHAEQNFGTGTDPEVTLTLGDHSIRFRGQIDRIDRHSGGRIRVTDYKTGKSDKYRDLTNLTPTNSGLQFQLPVYGLFARTLGDDVEARYWFVTSKGKFASIGYPITDDVITTLTDDMDLVHRSIRAGHFPPKIEDTHWELPVIDLLGRAGLRRAWAALEGVNEIADYVRKYGG